MRGRAVRVRSTTVGRPDRSPPARSPHVGGVWRIRPSRHRVHRPRAQLNSRRQSEPTPRGLGPGRRWFSVGTTLRRPRTVQRWRPNGHRPRRVRPRGGAALLSQHSRQVGKLRGQHASPQQDDDIPLGNHRTGMAHIRHTAGWRNTALSLGVTRGHMRAARARQTSGPRTAAAAVQSRSARSACPSPATSRRRSWQPDMTRRCTVNLHKEQAHPPDVRRYNDAWPGSGPALSNLPAALSRAHARSPPGSCCPVAL
ncbi:hypothetical protein QF035_010256 [Streptomyces umbrinus]|uniref:Transposase n=1 Tax=Streptomyces umbrinus TaxID=67370 RepID=A0ABU0TA35_9ACTN|nr:hypothetical protein [Streptomyces umbrinus]